MQRKIPILLVSLAAVAAFGALAYWWLRPAATPGILDASGQVRGTEVTVSARIGGVAREVAIRESQMVQKGDLLVRIASEELQARRAQAEAQVDTANNRLAVADAELRSLDTAIEQAQLSARAADGAAIHDVHRATEALRRAQAEAEAAEAEARQQRRNLERLEKLAAEGFVSSNYFDEARARTTASEARLRAARRAVDEAIAAVERSRVGSTEAEIKGKEVERLRAERERLIATRTAMESELSAARARLDEAEAALSDATITSPASGTVINKLVEEGELVAPGRPLAVIVDLTELYVRVYVPEADIGKLRLDNPARIHADAFPGRHFPGRVIEIAQQAEFTPKEVHMKDERVKLVFGVKIRIDNPQGYLKPGMPVDVKIRWRDDAAW